MVIWIDTFFSLVHLSVASFIFWIFYSYWVFAFYQMKLSFIEIFCLFTKTMSFSNHTICQFWNVLIYLIFFYLCIQFITLGKRANRVVWYIAIEPFKSCSWVFRHQPKEFFSHVLGTSYLKSTEILNMKLDYKLSTYNIN